MRRIIPLFFTVLLTVSSAFCTSSLLRLERADTPDGQWQEVPANTLPVTAEGAFQDTYASDTGYYRMRIDPSGEWGIPLELPLEDVPAMGIDLAQKLLGDMRNMEGDNAWEDAILGPIAFPIYDPAVSLGRPAYVEFKVILPEPNPGGGALQGSGSPEWPLALAPPVDCNRDRGFIVVSLTEGDLPVVEYATEGSTQTECLRKRAKASAVRIVRYDESFTAAENEKGEILAQIGPDPILYPDEILQLCDKEFEGYGDPQGEKNPDDPGIEGKPYPSYQAFKDDFLRSGRFQEARKRRKERASVEWEIYNGLHEEVINVLVGEQKVVFEQTPVVSFSVGDPSLADIQILATSAGLLIVGKKPGTTTLHVEFENGEVADGLLIVSEKPVSPEQPTGWTSWTEYYAGSWSDQRRYVQEPGGSCWSGCGATAWAMLYGWFDYTGAATNLIAGGAAPLYNNDYVRNCIWYVVPEIGTYCVGSQGATNPWNMWKGKRWASYRGHGYSYSYKWTSPCLGWAWSGPRDKAIDAIKTDHRPAIIGIGCSSAHYPLAYGYKYRRYRVWGVTWYTQRRFKCNMGWGGGSPEWKDADGVWFGLRANFY